YIRQTIAELVAAGAGVVAVPCNTAHLLYAHWAEGAAVPVPHIMVVSAQRVADRGGSKVAVLESASLRKSGADPAAVREQGLEAVPLSEEEAQLVAALIAAIKLRGKPNQSERETFRQLARTLVERGADALLLGCTELGVFGGAAPSGCLVVDSNQELAR